MNEFHIHKNKNGSSEQCRKRTFGFLKKIVTDGSSSIFVGDTENWNIFPTMKVTIMSKDLHSGKWLLRFLVGTTKMVKKNQGRKCSLGNQIGSNKEWFHAKESCRGVVGVPENRFMQGNQEKRF